MLPSGEGNSRAHWKLSFWFLGFVSEGENSTAASVSLLQDTHREDRQRGHRSATTANICTDLNGKQVLYNMLYNVCAGNISIYLQIDRYGPESISKTFPALTCYLALNNSLPNEKYNYWDTPAEEKCTSTFWQNSKFSYPVANQSNVHAASNEKVQISPQCFQLNMVFLLFKNQQVALGDIYKAHIMQKIKRNLSGWFRAAQHSALGTRNNK